MLSSLLKNLHDVRDSDDGDSVCIFANEVELEPSQLLLQGNCFVEDTGENDINHPPLLETLKNL